MVDSGLATGRRMEIENNAQSGFPAPSNQPVEQCPARSFKSIFPICARPDEKRPMQRHTHGVESGRFDEVDVGLGDIDVAELRPESSGVLGSDQRANDSVDLGWCARPGKLEHIAFRHEPIAEIYSLDGETSAVTVDEVSPVGPDKSFWRRGAHRDREEQREPNRRLNANRQPSTKPRRHSLYCSVE